MSFVELVLVFIGLVLMPLLALIIVLFMLTDLIKELRRKHGDPPIVARRMRMPKMKIRPLFQSSDRKINKDVGP